MLSRFQQNVGVSVSTCLDRHSPIRVRHGFLGIAVKSTGRSSLMKYIKLRDLTVSRIGLGAMGMSHGYTGHSISA